jgi:hypothetical protein
LRNVKLPGSFFGFHHFEMPWQREIPGQLLYEPGLHAVIQAANGDQACHEAEIHGQEDTILLPILGQPAGKVCVRVT